MDDNRRRFLRGDYGVAGAWRERGLALLHETGDRGGKADLLNDLALVAQARGDEPAERELFERSVALAFAAGNVGRQAEALGNLGLPAIREGQLELAREHLGEARSLCRRRLPDRRALRPAVRPISEWEIQAEARCGPTSSICSVS